jgi:hypothetical protein
LQNNKNSRSRTIAGSFAYDKSSIARAAENVFKNDDKEDEDIEVKGWD